MIRRDPVFTISGAFVEFMNRLGDELELHQKAEGGIPPRRNVIVHPSVLPFRPEPPQGLEPWTSALRKLRSTN